MNVLILGAAGGMALATVHDLLATMGQGRIVVSDINDEILKTRVAGFKDERLTAVKLDLSDIDAVAKAMGEVDVVINEANYHLNLNAMRAAMKAGKPILDLGGLYEMTLKQTAIHDEVEKSGILVIPGMGSDPGTSNVMCRHGANKLDEVEEIKIRFGTSWSGQTFGFAIETILDEAVKNAVIFEDGQFREVPALSLCEDVEFRSPVGPQTTYTILHSELATIPRTIKGVKKVTYFDTWDPETVAKLKNLEALGLLNDREVTIGGERMTNKKAMVKLLSQAVQEEKAAHGWDVLKITVSGQSYGHPTSYSYQIMTPGLLEEGITPTSYSTGVPPSIVAQMIAAGEVQGKGVLPPEMCVDPEKYLAHLKQRRFEVYETMHQEKQV